MFVRTLNSTGVGSQGEFYTLFFTSSPILHRSPRNALVSVVLWHTKETLVFNFVSMKLDRGWYFDFNTRATRECGFLIILHPYFTKTARLNSSNSQNPNPPSCFPRHMSFQFFQTTPLFLPPLLYRKSQTRDSTSSHSPLGRRKHCMAYVWIACNVD